MVNKNVSIDGEDYEVLPEVVNEALAAILFTWDTLGRPKTVFSDAGEKLMTVIISTWRDLYPRESDDWIEARKEYKLHEKTLREQVRSHSGRSLASIPLYIYKIMKQIFTDDKVQDSKYYQRLVKRYNIFQMANRV